MLANMSQSNAVLAAAGGQDPLAGAMQAGQDGKNPGDQVWTHQPLSIPFPPVSCAISFLFCGLPAERISWGIVLHVQNCLRNSSPCFDSSESLNPNCHLEG